jgi:hypothetical protein
MHNKALKEGYELAFEMKQTSILSISGAAHVLLMSLVKSA